MRGMTKNVDKRLSKTRGVSSPKEKRKLQVSNGYLMEFDQLARVLTFLADQTDAAKVSRVELIENTGLSNRQIESLVSIGAALGLINRSRQSITDVGLLIATNDIFFERKGTLEWAHYTGAGSYRNLVWYEVFNSVLVGNPAMLQEAWVEFLAVSFKDQYTENTLSKHLREETRFIADGYLNRNFRKLELLNTSRDGKLYIKRYANPEPLILCAMLYDQGFVGNTMVLQVRSLTEKEGSPGLLFGMDVGAMRKSIERLHQKNWVHYESTHDLDQVRLLEGFDSIHFLKAYYEGMEPQRQSPLEVKKQESLL